MGGGEAGYHHLWEERLSSTTYGGGGERLGSTTYGGDRLGSTTYGRTGWVTPPMGGEAG